MGHMPRYANYIQGLTTLHRSYCGNYSSRLTDEKMTPCLLVSTHAPKGGGVFGKMWGGGKPPQSGPCGGSWKELDDPSQTCWVTVGHSAWVTMRTTRSGGEALGVVGGPTPGGRALGRVDGGGAGDGSWVDRSVAVWIDTR